MTVAVVKAFVLLDFFNPLVSWWGLTGGFLYPAKYHNILCFVISSPQYVEIPYSKFLKSSYNFLK